MTNKIKKLLLLLAIYPIIVSCNSKEKIDLSKLTLNEPIDKLINFDDKLLIGIETVEYPFSLLIENEESKNYTFDGIDLKGQKIIFQINSETLKTDSITRFGGGHMDLVALKSTEDLNESLKKYKAENKIYGIRIGIESQKLKTEILKKLQSKYGKGIKNPNTENGLYWNVKNENKFIFFAPDYGRLIILDNTKLSKTCYWDTFNGLIDFGGCDNQKYIEELTKNRTKPEDIKNKPIIKINKNWNVNELITNKSTESDFVKSFSNKNFERMLTVDPDENILALQYQNVYNDLYFYFETSDKKTDNPNKNILVGYNISDLNKIEVIFENGLKKGMKYEDVIKHFDKNQIINYEDLKFSNYIEIKNEPYKITLNFDSENKLSGLYTNIKNYR